MAAAAVVVAGRDLLATPVVLALVSPPFFGAYAWIMMLGRNGFVRTALEEIGIELPSIYGYLGYPFVFLLASSSLRTINPSQEEAAEGLGAGPWRRFFAVTLPLVFPAVSTGASILKQMRESIEEAAVSLGASPARAFAVITLPLMRPASWPAR